MGDKWAEYPLEKTESPFICDLADACDLEKMFIKEFDSMRNGYNCSPGGEEPVFSTSVRNIRENSWYTPPIRSLTCNRCSHQYETTGDSRDIAITCRCDITGRKGSVSRGMFCLQFEDRIKNSFDEEVNGFKVRSKQVEDYRTRNQWERAGYAVKKGAIGTEMYAVLLAAENNGRRYIYYLPEEVEKLE